MDGYGWQIEDGTLQVTWMTRNSAPDSVLHVIHCGCKSACETGRCSCFSAGLCCTDLCRCCNCANTKETEELEDNCPDTDGEDCVSLICYSLFCFVQFYISYFILFMKIVFMVDQCCFHSWKNEWKNYIYIYAFSRRFYPKRFPRESFTKVHIGHWS